MSNHRNHGNRPTPVRGFRPGRAPVVIEQEKPISTKMGINIGKMIVVVEYDRPVNNLHLTLEQVDTYIEHLAQCRSALMDVRSKAIAAEGNKG